MSERLVIDSIMLKPFGELPTGIKAAILNQYRQS